MTCRPLPATIACSLIGSCLLLAAEPSSWQLKVSSNGRFLQKADGSPFFWLGDTGWLMFKRLDRAETERYLDDRRAKGYNVVQVMVLHTAADRNIYNSPALTEGDPAQPAVTPGHDIAKPGEYDFWDHVDWAIDAAAQRGIYIGMVAAWGSIARSNRLNEKNVEPYTRFLAERYRTKPNIVWITGGDTYGDRNTEVWRTMGRTFKALDPAHLVTFHPFGRTQSSTHFHADPWLDFNMFQSGHRRYDQDDTPSPKGEDNWRYVREDYEKTPPKPTIDGEPSYEGIPQGLHDWKEPLWKDYHVRRYAWWSVLAGAFGHTYGAAGVMNMTKPSPNATSTSTTPRKLWFDAINEPGAAHMQWVKNLVLSRPFFERVADQELIAAGSGTRHEYVSASRGNAYAFVYTYLGKPFEVRMGRISGSNVRAWWYDPRTGTAKEIGRFPNKGTKQFQPPGTPGEGNDWVLVLDDAQKKFSTPGSAPR